MAVAVTVNMGRAELGKLVGSSSLVGGRPFGVVQLHGDERASLADYLIGRGAKVIKAFRVAGPDFASKVSRGWPRSASRPDCSPCCWTRHRILPPLGGSGAPNRDASRLGTPVGEGDRVEIARQRRRYGGTGRRFNWEWIAEARNNGELAGWPPLLLAGGLTPANVAKAIRIAHPWGVDVAGGVEVADSPGVKSIDRIRDFIRNARVG